MNWHVSGASAFSDDGAAPIELLVAEGADRGCCGRAVVPKQFERRLLRDRLVLLGMFAIHLVNVVPS